MREIISHRPGRIVCWLLFLSVIWYVFGIPLVVQDVDFLFLGWMPLVTVLWYLQTIFWLVVIWIYTSKYWPYR